MRVMVLTPGWHDAYELALDALRRQFLAARRHASASLAICLCVCLSVCLSQAGTEQLKGPIW